MDESITRSAGASHGQEMTPTEMEAVISSLGRTPRQRNTLYESVAQDRYRASFAAEASSARTRAAPIEQGAASAT
jgi:FO synthase